MKAINLKNNLTRFFLKQDTRDLLSFLIVVAIIFVCRELVYVPLAIFVALTNVFAVKFLRPIVLASLSILTCIAALSALILDLAYTGYIPVTILAYLTALTIPNYYIIIRIGFSEFINHFWHDQSLD